MWPARLSGSLWIALPWAAPSWTQPAESTSACRGQSLFHTFSMTPGPALGTLSSPQCPVQTGSPGRASRTRTEASRAAPGARLARSGGAPRRCQEGRPLIPGAASRELPFGSARAAAGGGAALRRAALLPGPGRGRWMPRLRSCCLPGGLRRPVSAGRRGWPLGSGPGPGWGWVGGGGGGAGSGREGGRAAGPVGSSSSPVPWKRRPGLPAPVPGRAAQLGAGTRGRPGGGREGELRPLLPPRGAGGGRTGWPSVSGGRSGLGGAQVAPSCGVEAAARGVGGFSRPGPGPPDRLTDRGSEEGSREGEHLHRVLYPSQRPSPFHCQADTGLLSKEQLPDSWQNNGDPASLGPLPLGQKTGGGWVNGRLWGLGRASCPLRMAAHLTSPCQGVGCVWEGWTICPRPLGETALMPRPANLSCQLLRQWEGGDGKVRCPPPPCWGCRWYQAW